MIGTFKLTLDEAATLYSAVCVSINVFNTGCDENENKERIKRLVELKQKLIDIDFIEEANNDI